MDVITLQPGSGSQRNPADRPDWTPIAQQPDKFGIMAHTPDPTMYHYDATGRVIVPRATRHGGSRAYDVRQNNAVVNIDPTDPVRGTGGITVRMGTIPRDVLKRASEEAGEDATLAWAIASQQANQVAAMDPQKRGVLGVTAQGPPTGYGGYVVPKATAAGGQQAQSMNQPWHPSVQAQVVPGGMNGHTSFHPAVIKTAISPSIQGPDMARPTPIQDPMTGGPLPQAMYQQPQYQQPPQQQPVYQQPQYQQPQQQPQQWPQQPQFQPPQQIDVAGMMGQMMNQFTQALQNLQRPYTPPPVQPQGPLPYPPIPPYQQDPPRASYQGVPGEEDEDDDDAPWTPPDKRQERPAAPRRASGPGMADCKLPFLTNPPSKPRYRVIFDLGRGGKHSKHFHEIAVQGVCLSLIYDDRHDGDRFVPMETEQGETILVKLPQRLDEEGNEIPPQTYRVAVPNFHQTIGCLDILNLVIIPENKLPSPRDVMEEMD